MSALREAVPVVMPGKLSPARQALAAANERVAAVGAEVDRLAEPANRLGRIIGEADRLERRRAELETKDREILTTWLLVGDGDRPQPSPELLQIERQLIEARRDRAAAEAAVPDANMAFQQATLRLREAGQTRDTALYQVGAEAACGYIDRVLRMRVREALAARVVVESLVEVLGFGPGAPNGGQAAAGRIREHLKPVLAASQLRDSDGARRFLDRLANDPAAELER